MKKIIALITVLALCLAFSSCSKKRSDEPTTDEMSSTAEVTESIADRSGKHNSRADNRSTANSGTY